MGPPLDISLGHELVDQLCCRLPGHAQVDGELADRRAAGSQPGEGKAVRRAHVVKASRRHPGLDAVHEGVAGGENKGTQGQGIVITHSPSLAN